MRKSIKIMAGTRVAAALLAVIIFSILTTQNIYKMEDSSEDNIAVNALLQRAQKAEAAHYKWEAGTEDKTILDLRNQLEPLHKQLHESAIYVLDLYAADPAQAQAYYQETIMSNLGVLVGLLEQVVERGTELNEISEANMEKTVSTMHIVTGIGLLLTLFFLMSLVLYIIKRVVKPILLITEKTSPLQEGCMKVELNYNANDEIGDLSRTLKQSIDRINQYIEDINRIMSQLSNGNFDVGASVPFIGDFRSISDSIDSFTRSLSSAMSNINNVEYKVFGHAQSLSGSSQMLAQGATDQAAAVEELTATTEDLARSAEKNMQMASEMRDNARMTGDQVNLSSQQMEQLVSAMSDISNTSQEIENIISTIENIAFQTNILALNAAVEASRAGEAGKGFAVVAKEVRDLAAKSDQAAKATKDLIENSVQAAGRGSRIVDEVSESLKRTLTLVTESNSAVEEFADAVQIEATAISQVSEALGQISNVVQTNTANSEESAAVSAELYEQVNRLKTQTSRFKLKN